MNEPPKKTLDARIAELEDELSACQRTVEALMDAAEAGRIGELDRFGVARTIAYLENMLDARDRERAEWFELHTALYSKSQDAIVILDAEGRVESCNATAEALLGRNAEELRGVPVSAVMEPTSGAALTGLLWAGFSGTSDSPITLSDGRRVRFSVGALSEGRRIVTLRDDTARYLLEEELQQARRLASIGHLAGGVAHQINNPLAVIQGRVELLQAIQDPEPESIARHLDVVMDHCRRIAGIVQNLQAFSRPREADRRWLGVAEVLKGVPNAAGLARVRVQSKVDPVALEVFADPEQLQQILLNLTVLAAGPGPRARTVALAVHTNDRGDVVFDLSGPGVTETLLEEFGEPYPPQGRGLDPAGGLAMAISWALVREHGGLLEGLDGQSTIRLVLPPATAAVTREVQAVEEPSDPCRILVVDDEQLLCETVTWMLAEQGHSIVAVHAAEDALTRLARESFDIVLTDLRLPGMDGESLIRTIERRWPGLAMRTILTSGVLYSPGVETTYLQKPFTRAQLLEAINRLR